VNQSDLNTKGNNRILSDTLIYVLSTVIQSGVQLLFIPYLTRVLSLSEYGEVELFITLNGLFNIAILFGVNTKIYEDSKRYNSFSLVEDRNEYKCEKYGLLFYNGLVLIIASLLINLFYDFKFIYLIYASFYHYIG